MTISQVLRSVGIDHLHYMAPVDNAVLIGSFGIFSYNHAKAFEHHDVSDSFVQWRRRKLVSHSGRSVHDYVPLYFATHTPMQYTLTNGGAPIMAQDDLVFFEVHAESILSRDGVVFTDGNAASSRTVFYRDSIRLLDLDWDIIIRTPDCYSREYRRVKCAEVLVPDYVPPNDITRIVVYSRRAKDLLLHRLSIMQERAPTVTYAAPIIIDRSHYYD